MNNHAAPEPSRAPLEGIRVLDLTSVLMGPFATQILGDFGADVIKIESPAGDSARGLGPMRHGGMGASFLHNNRNKRSVVLDLKQPAGRDALLRLARSADVVVSNIRPRSLARLGLSHRDFASANPRIITAALVGYGQQGPYAASPAYDDLIQGMLAIPSLLAIAGDGTPRYIPLSLMDRGAALAAVNVILGALLHRERTGEGQAVEIPMFETMVPLVLGEHMAGRTFTPSAGPVGYPRLLAKERQAYATRGGFICVLVYTDKHWQDYFRIIGEPERFHSDPRFRDLGTRTVHASEICRMLSETLRTRDTAQWLEAFAAADIPATPLHTIESLIDDPHLRSVGYFMEDDHPTEGRITSLSPMGTWSHSPTRVRRLAPRLGEHSIEVLRAAGLREDEIQALLAACVTLAPQPTEEC